MAYLIVRIKPTTIDRVVSLTAKLKKYDIVESVESHNDDAQQGVQSDAANWVCSNGHKNDNDFLGCWCCGVAAPLTQ